MKDFLERHASRLAPGEKNTIRERVTGTGARGPRGRVPWQITALAGTAALTVVALTLTRPAFERGAPRRGPNVATESPAPTIVLPPSAMSMAPAVEAPRKVAGQPVFDAAPKPDRAEPTIGAPEELLSGGHDAEGETEYRAPAPPTSVTVMKKEVQEVRVTAQRLVDTKSSSTKQSVSGETLKDLPVANLRDAVGLKAGSVVTGGQLHVRGGRGGEIKQQIDGISVADPLVVPTTGGEKLPNDEAFDSMFFKNYGVNPFVAADEDPFSTFAVDVDNGSYTLARRYLDLSTMPPKDAVRVEEFVNFFPQGYPRFERETFRILTDGAPSPFGAGYQLVRVGIKGREIAAENRKPAVLTFVIDISGSMAREDRLGTVKQSLAMLVDELRPDDRVGIVVYGSNGRVLLEPVSLRERGRILEAIERLVPDGSTNAEEGLLLGYEMARRAFREGANNRILLCADGVANVGRTGPESILARVRSEADRGIHLTTIGFGMGNYNDVLMEQLADKGDGNYYYVDDLAEAQRVLVEGLTGTLQTIAKDAKIQVEFDSTRVLRYRLLGFENRDVADRDFRNDRVDAGEIGAGHEVTALYEVKLARGVTRGTLATVRLRWADPEAEDGGAPKVREIERKIPVESLASRFGDASPRFRLDAAVAEFAEILRGSYWAKESRLADVLPVARSAANALGDETSHEFVRLVEKAAALPKP